MPHRLALRLVKSLLSPEVLLGAYFVDRVLVELLLVVSFGLSDGLQFRHLAAGLAQILRGLNPAGLNLSFSKCLIFLGFFKLRPFGDFLQMHRGVLQSVYIA